MSGSNPARGLIEKFGELVILPPFMRNTGGPGNVTTFLTDGVLWGLSLDGDGPNHTSGVEGIQKAFGILGEAALGVGMQSAFQTGIAIRTMTMVPKSLRYSYDIATGIEVLSCGMDPPEGVAVAKGGIKGIWDRNGFVLISNRDRNRCIRDLIEDCPDHKLAIYLSNKKGEGSYQSLGIFRVDHMPEEIKAHLDENDKASVADRHRVLAHSANWKGSKVFGGQKPPAELPAPLERAG